MLAVSVLMFLMALHRDCESVTIHVLDWGAMLVRMCSSAIAIAAYSSSYELVAGAPFFFRVSMVIGSSVEPDVTTAAAPPFVRPPEADPSVYTIISALILFSWE